MRFLICLFTIFIAFGAIKTDPINSDYSQDIKKSRSFFNARLLSFLDHNSGGKNVLVSTFGLHSVLSSVLDGAEHDTFNQLWEALGYKYSSLNRATMLDANEQTFKNLTELRKLGLTFANLLSVDKSLSLKESYRRDLGQAFGTELLEEDFKNNNKKATDELNEWVKTMTKGKIEKLFDNPLDTDTRAVIMNALHFKSNWRNQFDNRSSYIGKFNLSNGKTKNVTYMTISGKQLKGAEYLHTSGFSIARIPFDNEGRLWFSIILPDSMDTDFHCCLSSLSFIEHAKPQRIHLTLPKFEISQTHDKLKAAMVNMNVTDLFDQNRADFHAIDGKRDLFIKDILQKTILKIDETGAEGAAVTAVIGAEITSVHPPQTTIPFVVDRPFMFVISDKHTNVDFFTGIVYDP